MFWLIIGLGLFFWSIYEFIVGETWTYRKIYRDYEPGLFWVVSVLWFLLSLTITIPTVISYLG